MTSYSRHGPDLFLQIEADHTVAIYVRLEQKLSCLPNSCRDGEAQRAYLALPSPCLFSDHYVVPLSLRALFAVTRAQSNIRPSITTRHCTGLIESLLMRIPFAVQNNPSILWSLSTALLQQALISFFLKKENHCT
jgi:hypothetical protein